MEHKQTILSFDAYELQKYEPNRYPYLYIDRVTECVPGKYAKGYKNFTNNEWFFPIHYPGHPFVPGSIQVETLSQMVTIAFTTMSGVKDINVIGCQVTAKWNREIHPGDRLDIEAFITFCSRGVCKGYAKSYVDGELACEISVVQAIPSELDKYKPKDHRKV